MKYVEQWQRDFSESDGSPSIRGRSEKAIRLRRLYESLAVQLFHQYEPTKRETHRASRDFLLRLNSWLDCFESDEDRWVAFQSVEYIFFAGQQEFEELYRCAYEHAILPWVVDCAGFDIFSNDIEKILRDEIEGCWPCPVTDSLRINGFLHVTGMSGKPLRPDWLSLRELGSSQRIDQYVKANGIKYLVLIEDFVGSGSQLCRALTYAAKVFVGPILVVPLIVCAPGDDTIKRHLKRLGRSDITYRPQVVLEQSCLVGQTPSPDEPKLFQKLRDVMAKAQSTIAGGASQGEAGEEYGYKKVGSLVVLYSNCPNNTPPIFHKNTRRWKPPFPRSARV